MFKCNPLQWLWGLLPLTLLWWIGLLGMQQRIEEDLALRANEHLARNNLGWAKVVFKGRDGLLQGRAEEESDQRRPATEVAKVWGIRALEDRIEVLQNVRNYVWHATAREGVLALTGYVPNEAARKAILASVRSSFPKHKVEDRMELARGAPEQKQWLAGTAFALRQLAALKTGGRAGLEAAGLVLEGEADSSKGYETIRNELTRSLPQGISLKNDRVMPPVVKPFTWAAALRGRQIELTGHVPSVGARDQIKAAAGKAVSGATIVDRMTVASGAPGDWQKVAAIGLAKLGQLKQGSAEMVDNQLTLNGLTETEAAAEAIRKAQKSELPASYRLIEQVRQDPAVKAAEEAARRAAAEAEARRVADLQRQQADAEAKARAADETARRQAEAEARRDVDQQKRLLAEQEAKRKAEDDARRAAEAKRKADEDARRAAETKRKAEEALSVRHVEAQRCQKSLQAAVDAGTITFQRASAELDRRSHQTLDALAQIVKGCPGFAIEVGGHTDNEGEPERNLRLSERRAKSVLEYLQKIGVPSGTLTSVGYGETKPKVANDNPANMAVNRRIEFIVKPK